MNFVFPVYIPSIKQFVNCKELHNKHYVSILKFIANNDDKNLDLYFNKLIDTLCVDINCNKLNKIDKFCVLLTLRIMCIGPDLSLVLTCSKTNQNYNGNINLNDVLQMVSDLRAARRVTLRVNDSISITIAAPQTLCCTGVNNTLDIVTDTIHEITIDGTIFNMNELTISEKNNIIDSIQGVDFNKVLQHAGTQQKSFNNLIIFQDKNPHDEDAQVRDYKIGLYDNSMFDVIKMTFTSDLNNFYTSMYSLCHSMNISADYILNITPAESNIYITQKQQEIERQKAEQQNKQPQTIGAPSPMAF